jgi:serine protease Do
MARRLYSPLKMQRVILGLSLALALALGALGGVLLVRTRPAAPERAFADVVERANPAVVYISVIEDEAPRAVGFLRSPDPGPRRGEGTGFIVDADGYILTNQHVIGQDARIRVRLSDRRELPARVVGADASTDLALLKVEATGLPTLALGDSDRLRVGEWVCAIGNPYHFEHSVTVGVVSSKGRKIYDASFDSYIQTDAAINPGNSGGPLVNARGEAVGINAAVSTEGQGIGFAIPANVARDVLQQLRAHGHVTRGYLGIQLDDLDPDLQRLVHARDDQGAVVVDVVKGAAGDRAGLRRYDVITAVGETKVADGDELVRVISAGAPGSTVHLGVTREGRPLSIEAQLEERDADEPARAPGGPARAVPASGGDVLGLVTRDMPRVGRGTAPLPEHAGVVVRDVVGLAPGLDALDPGDIIVEVNRMTTRRPSARRSR